MMTTANHGKRRGEAEKNLLAFLVRSKHLGIEQAESLERWAIAEDLSLIQALAARGVLSEEQLAGALASALRLPLMNLDTAPYDDHVTAYLKEDVAARCLMV